MFSGYNSVYSHFDDKNKWFMFVRHCCWYSFECHMATLMIESTSFVENELHTLQLCVL